MSIPSELSRLIEIRVEEYVNDSSNPEYLRRPAAELRVLPLFNDWEYFLAIRSDGEIITVPTEDKDSQPHVERDDLLRKVARDESLNELGAQGWELVSAVFAESSGVTYTFKRQK